MKFRINPKTNMVFNSSFADEIKEIQSVNKSKKVKSPTFEEFELQKEECKEVIQIICQNIRESIKNEARMNKINYDYKYNFWDKKIESNPKYIGSYRINFVLKIKTENVTLSKFGSAWDGEEYGVFANNVEIFFYIIEEVINTLLQDGIYYVKHNSFPRFENYLKSSIDFKEKEEKYLNLVKNYESNTSEYIVLDTPFVNNFAYFI